MAAISAPSKTKRSGSIEPTESDTPPLFYEDLSVGQSWRSPIREITLEDVHAFSSLTGDFDPLHAAGIAAESGASRVDSPFGRPVAHGLLGLSILAGLSTEFPRVATLALVGLTDWQFENPIFFGEVVHVVTEVEASAPHGRRAGRITWLRKLISSDRRLLQQGRIITLVASHKRAGFAQPCADAAYPRRPR